MFKSESNMWNVMVVLVTISSLAAVADAQDGCSISGKPNVCCDNAGVGPWCSICSS